MSKTLSRLFGFGGLLLALPSSALAEGFTGFYAGAEAGYAHFSPVTGTGGSDGGIYYGGVLGGRVQTESRFVFGVEGTFGGSTLNAPVNGIIPLNLELDRSYGFDGIAGYALSDTLLLFTNVGYANTKANLYSVGVLQASGTLDGVRFGGGLEYKLSESFSLRAKINHNKADGTGITTVNSGLLFSF